jgi:DNA-binding NtrC family response regulator
MTKKDLEDTIKEKVNPLLEETMEKSWGVTIPKLETDITSKLKESSLNIYIPLGKDFSESKKQFKKEFLKQELRLHLGNISQLAKVLDMDRRSIHRAIKDFHIDMDDVRQHEETPEHFQEEVVDKKIRTSLEQYTGLIQAEKMQDFYKELPKLSRNIAKFLPKPDMTWKEAEAEFERQFLKRALEEHNNNITKTAKKIDIRVETLHRKIKKLHLK